MFVVTEEDAAAIRAVYEQRGEFAAAVELRRLFPGITDNAQARECARTIAGWKPLPLRPVKRTLPPLSRQSISLPVLKYGTAFSSTWIVSWVRGLRMMRALRCFTVKAPNLRSSTRSPRARAAAPRPSPPPTTIGSPARATARRQAASQFA